MDNKPKNENLNDATRESDIEDVLKIMQKRNTAKKGSATAANSGGVASGISINAPIPKKADMPAEQKSVPEEKTKQDISQKAEPPKAESVKEQPQKAVSPTPAPSADATRVSFDKVAPPVQQKKEAAAPANTAKPKEQPVKTPTTAQNKQTPTQGKASIKGVSLDDFNKEAKWDKKKEKIKTTFLGSVKFGMIKLLLYIGIVAVCCFLISSTVINVGNDIFAFVKNDTAVLLEEQNVIVTLPEDADTGDVAKILKKAGVIEYPSVFEMYAKFRISKRSYLTGEYLVGEVTVNPMMNYDTLINTLASYERSVSGTVRITIPEGLTVDETLELLESKGVGKKADFMEALQNFDYDYKFMDGLTPGSISEHRFNTDISYRIEGYLFPDTYDFYLNENPISALDKFLTNFNKKFEEEFYTRCDKLGMTVDEVITLASMIEKEGNNAADYYYISSVFHNRLYNNAQFPFLNSDATIQYALKERTGLYTIDTTMSHPYNTYNNNGLPPGPICNPSIEAIYAALYPESTSYYYFYTKKNGETVFSRTYEQHMNYVNSDK